MNILQPSSGTTGKVSDADAAVEEKKKKKKKRVRENEWIEKKEKEFVGSVQIFPTSYILVLYI